MARSAFTGGLFPTLLNHVGPLQGAWGHWGALIRLHGVSGCCQRPSRPTRSTVAVSVPYWGHTAAVCLLVDVMARLRLPTRPRRPPPTPPLPSRWPTHPPIQNVPLRTVFANPVTYHFIIAENLSFVKHLPNRFYAH